MLAGGVRTFSTRLTLPNWSFRWSYYFVCLQAVYDSLHFPVPPGADRLGVFCHVVGMEWSPCSVFICMSRMVNLGFTSPVYWPSRIFLLGMPVHSLCPFFYCIVFLLLICGSSLYLLEQILHQIWQIHSTWCKIFSWSVAWQCFVMICLPYRSFKCGCCPIHQCFPL